MARVRTTIGAWLILHGATMVPADSAAGRGDRGPRPPGPDHPLLVSVYGLTERERDVTRLVLEGSSTQQMADELVLSPHTVQQHLKSIFDKTGVRSRRDLVGKVFFAHYEPRLRDNEDRAGGWSRAQGRAVPAGIDRLSCRRRPGRARLITRIGQTTGAPAPRAR